MGHMKKKKNNHEKKTRVEVILAARATYNLFPII